MFDRLGRSWNLVKFSVSVLQQDKELLVFPLLSAIAAMAVLGSFLPLILADVAIRDEGSGAPMNDQVDMALIFIIYVIEYFVMFFFNAALVSAALERVHGGNPTVASGLKVAFAKIGIIFFYSIIAATVGVLLRSIGERGGLVGRLLSGITGIVWSLASFLVVPVLVSRNVGPIDAVKESLSLMRRTWGENIIANAGLGIVFFLVYIGVTMMMFALMALSSSLGSGTGIIGLLAIFVVLFVVIALVQATLQGIFSAALYHYAIDGEDDAGIPAAILGGAFSPKKP